MPHITAVQRQADKPVFSRTASGCPSWIPFNSSRKGIHRWRPSFASPPGCWVIVVVLVAWAPFAVARPAAEPPTKLQQQVLKSSVWVFLPKGPPKGGKWEFEAATGFVVDVKRRLVLTSSHVVKTNTKATVFFPQYADDKLVTERMTYLEA